MSIRREACALCGGRVETVAALPALPLTDTYCRPGDGAVAPSARDQALQFCSACGHGQLERVLPPASLYGNSYRFRTSASATARRGCGFFLSALETAAPGKRFECVLDLGCNDLHLLDEMAGRAAWRIGVDPIWAGREAEAARPGLNVLGCPVEAVDFASLAPCPDVVLCRHTLEHIVDPAGLMARLLDAFPRALFLFEVPGFDTLVERSRFDQVFHQHLHYFSQASFARLLERAGAVPLLWRFNPHDWGAMAVAFRHGSGPGAAPAPFAATADGLRAAYARFQGWLAEAGRHGRDLARRMPVYGYGAAQMLPVLAYHLGGVDYLAAVLDDDPRKDGLGYANLEVGIRIPAVPLDLSEAAVLLTAPDNAAPILRRLLSGARPRHILLPFPFL